jgi:hypothetical protein
MAFADVAIRKAKPRDNSHKVAGSVREVLQNRLKGEAVMAGW